jgi:hypothetical protein
MTTAAVWVAPDATGMTPRQQRVFELLCLRESGEFMTLSQCSVILGDKTPRHIYQTIIGLRNKGLVEEAGAPLLWRVRWIHRPTPYVRQGRRDGWLGRAVDASVVEAVVG